MVPFWDDIDLREGGEILYRITSDPGCLERARLDVLGAEFAGIDNFNPTFLLIATWYRVARFLGDDSQVGYLKQCSQIACKLVHGFNCIIIIFLTYWNTHFTQCHILRYNY